MFAALRQFGELSSCFLGFFAKLRTGTRVRTSSMLTTGTKWRERPGYEKWYHNAAVYQIKLIQKRSTLNQRSQLHIRTGSPSSNCVSGSFPSWADWKHWAYSLTFWMMYSRRNINNLRYTDDTTHMAESEEELKSLLMKVKEESEKVGLKQHLEN